jgi:glucosyl-dolichyl phosphate glucuronosyltransferase
MMTTPLTVSVIICAYTEARWDDLVAAVDSAQRQTRPPLETIVVIDHNPPLLERARGAFPAARVVANEESAGLAGARNTGIALSRGEIVAFLDDDAVAEPDWLERLAPAFEDPTVIGAGGAIEPLWPAGRPSWFPEEFDWVVGCTYRGMPEQRSPVRNLIGANMAFRREVFDTVRFYSGIGHMGGRPFGGSDPDFCIRVRNAWPRHELLYEPSARVHHRVSPNRARWSYFRLRCYNEGLSKSLLTRRVGARTGLSSERAYTARTLPLGVMRELKRALSGDPAGLPQAFTLVAGLAITGSGYLLGTISTRLMPQNKLPASESITA